MSEFGRLMIVVATGPGGVIGKDGKIPWHSKEDMEHFRQLTIGHAIIMGRKTWDSIGRPLPKRRNLVVTRNSLWKADGAEAFSSLEDAIAAARNSDEEPRVIGGARIYEFALPYTTTIVQTEINRERIEGDVYFPQISFLEWREISRKTGIDPSLQFVTRERIS